MGLLFVLFAGPEAKYKVSLAVAAMGFAYFVSIGHAFGKLQATVAKPEQHGFATPLWVRLWVTPVVFALACGCLVCFVLFLLFALSSLQPPTLSGETATEDV
eukprot:SAG22_NODE_2556_length_2451_cov_1.704932_2_plen_102_part_00